MTPFFDLALIESALAPLKAAGTVREIAVLGDASRADPSRALRTPPGLLIVPAGTQCTGPTGVGNGRRITEAFLIAIQVRQAAGQDRAAEASLRTIRAAVWDLLEALRPDPLWAPLRYEGGQIGDIDDTLFTWLDRYATESAAPTRPRT
jgi:hypothetical protein